MQRCNYNTIKIICKDFFAIIAAFFAIIYYECEAMLRYSRFGIIAVTVSFIALFKHKFQQHRAED